MSEPTCHRLCYSGESCFSNVGVYLPGTVLQWYRLFKRCRNLPAGHSVTGVRLYKQCQNLPAGHCVTCSDAGCLSSIGTYLPVTVLQGCRLFKQCWSLPDWHCVAGVQTISAMSEPTCRALCCIGAGCLRSVGTYLPGTVLQGCRLYKRCWNLPAGHCITVVRAV